MNETLQNSQRIYVGIDDTDNLETRGTGFRARQLINLLEGNRLATGIGVTRHQLLFDERVPYTSHNSSACLVMDRHPGVDNLDIWAFCRSFLLEIAADGSDVGLCLASSEQARQVMEFGQKAKVDLVGQDEARQVAKDAEIWLEGLTGDHQGIIGSLSAVGLHVHGNDGRYIWPREIRDIAGQTVPLPALMNTKGVEKVSLIDGNDINNDAAQITLGEWPRTVRIDHQAVLLVEPIDEQHNYKVLEKESIKSVRP